MLEYKSLHFFPFYSFPFFFDSEDDYRTGCRNVSHCQQQQSYSGLRSPGRSNSTFLDLMLMDEGVSSHLWERIFVPFALRMRSVLRMRIKRKRLQTFFDDGSHVTRRGLSINLSSTYHQPIIIPPSTYHQPTINLPSA